MPIPIQIKNIRLQNHPSARSQAVATVPITEASKIISVDAFAAVLIASEKGKRCDGCFQIKSEDRLLRKCTGCGSYWYCDSICQNMDWKAHHKKICKQYNKFTSSNAFHSLASHEKLESLLLDHLLSQVSSITGRVDEEMSPLGIFMSLLPGPTVPNRDVLSVCGFEPPIQPDTVPLLYSRFGNNNFAIHSHLTTIGHGIFPLASRLFNHSCIPNAAARYIFSAGRPVRMEVIALRNISPDSEITIPYLDPALYQTRQQIFDLTYGFRCTCFSCHILETLGPIPAPPASSPELTSIEKTLRQFTQVESFLDGGLPVIPQTNIPLSMYCVFHENYITNLSETFSKASHEGHYNLALDSGTTLLALYLLIYPPNYPQTGIHLLELAKTAWNMTVGDSGMDYQTEQATKARVRVFLSLGRRILTVFGPEGDEDGPLREAETLQSLLDP
ncbi:hypothetical protein BDZ94DRAFT_1309149 [Collybia nuda]|uniref:SET domain-containing protein n=1 Tax=Collybia nuda TaxID=64659 RepID=A0A9P6CEJ2_9AGAR|nr:hypothetical protein BDZ94DRAFT_1309149 [Collybia nuda]